MDECAQREATFFEAGGGVQTRGENRLGLPDAAGMVEEEAELGLHMRAFAWVGDPELERARKPCRRFVVGRGRGRRCGGTEVVVDATLDAREGSGDREVMGELGQKSGEIGSVGAFERFADPKVQLSASDTWDVVVDRPADELVGESAGGTRSGSSSNMPAVTASSIDVSNASWSSPAASSRSRSAKRGPATAASSSIAVVALERRDHRCLTTS